MSLVPLYRGLLATELQSVAAYRAQLLISGLDWVTPLVFLALWRGAARDGVDGITAAQFTTYFCLLLVTAPAQLSFDLSFALQDLVHSGRLSVLLLRPSHPAHGFIAHSVARKVFRVGPMLVIGPLLVVVLGGAVTTDAAQVALAVALAALGWLGEVYLGLMMGCVALWSTRSEGLRGLLYGAEWVLGGLVAPVGLLPGILPDLLRHQPLWFAIGAPAEAVAGIGRLGVGTLVEAGLWVVVLHLLLGVVWRRGLRRYEAVGT